MYEREIILKSSLPVLLRDGGAGFAGSSGMYAADRREIFLQQRGKLANTSQAVPVAGKYPVCITWNSIYMQ
ncbi:hypothetical protein HF324_11195 [Chitinophaga oryzae]|uniref:Uncharacterized protein n=1 Tax=Chitinophaga oryzae TaxID=2725414 RepID=A0ABX6LE65_9BACT|nr:hypothetical protein [Chitinophaga oryzae]QJB38399.1 hypothetical protein HF324_11195 [Chitinophaga oryzae]